MANSKYEYLIRQDIADMLQAAGFPVNAVTNHIKAFDEDIAKWTVSLDTSLEASNEIAETGGKRAIIGVELKTPCLSFTARSHQQVDRFIKLLNFRYKISLNQSCLLHVHVGIADPTTQRQIDFDLRIVMRWALDGKNLKHLLWIGEQVANELDLPTLLRLMGIEEEVVRYTGLARCLGKTLVRLLSILCVRTPKRVLSSTSTFLSIHKMHICTRRSYEGAV